MNKVKFLVCASILMMHITSCKKHTGDTSNAPDFTSLIRFSLFTTRDFSHTQGIISFSVFIEDSTKTLWDSMLPPMQIKDIPDSAHAIAIEKTITQHNASLLKVGFRYNIDNVGHAGYIDSSDSRQILKVVNFNFQ